MTSGKDPAGHLGQVDVAVVGAGFNGLYQLYRLRQEGFSVAVFEAGAGPGGVWYWNCYPGARVDSHVPNYEFSMEQIWRDWYWTERFPSQPELQRYFHHVVDVLALAPDIYYETRVENARFDETANRWSVETSSGVTAEARHLLVCTGFAAKPYVPDLPGLERFEGICHHTARWPQSGQSFDGLKVGVIGTGASGVQVVQEAAKTAAELTVFQRTPVMALAMQQATMSVEEQDEAKLGYAEMFRVRNEPPGSFADLIRLNVSAMSVDEAERNRVYEQAWARGGFHFWAATFNDILTNEQANRTSYDFWRDKTRARLQDPAVAELLAPTDPPYPFGTKRPSLEQDYYDVFNQPNVALVDVKADPISEVTPVGVRTADRSFELDMIVLATGFDANTGGLSQLGVEGRNGMSFAEYWADRVQLNLGVAAAGFPNLLFLYGPQSPTAFCNGPTCAELQGEWVVDTLRHMRDEGYTRLESTPEADAAWSEHCDAIAAATLFGQADSWYMGANVPGKPRQLLNYPLVDGYLAKLAETAAAGYPGFELS